MPIINVSTLTTAQKQQMFFQSPLTPPAPFPHTFGNLYLLRRDINDMKASLPNVAIWPRAMAVMAGIDLVAKFFADDDTIGSVGTRIKDFAKHYITSGNQTDADVLYQLRNSLLHSFGLYSANNNGTVVYRFTVVQDPKNWLLHQNPSNAQNWLVNLTELDKRFEAAVVKYDADITAGTKPFPTGPKNIFDKYGWTNIY